MAVGGRLVAAAMGLGLVVAAFLMVRYRDELYNLFSRDATYPVPIQLHDAMAVVFAVLLGAGGVAVIAVAIIG